MAVQETAGKVTDIWKYAAIALLSAFLTAAGHFAALGNNLTTRTEVSSMIAKESPYVPDRNLLHSIISRLDRIETKLDSLK